MYKKFIIDKSGWVYANFAKMAASNGGPQNLINTIYYAGWVRGIKNGVCVGAVGVVAALGVEKLIPWKIKAKNGKHGGNIFTNSYVDCRECGARFEHRSGPSLGCPNCNWSITDQEFKDGEYENGIFGYEL